jgi:LemA protein
MTDEEASMELTEQLREEGYTEEEAREIIRRAARLHGTAGGRVDASVLEESAAEVGIPSEWVQEAARQIRAERAAERQRRKTLGIVGIAAAVVLALFLWSSYNTLLRAETRVEAARAQLETVLQRRFDLVPRLAQVTREYAAHERAVFEALAAARERFQQAGTLPEKEAAVRELEAVLPRLRAIAESNPQLRASELYLRLMDELAGTENRVAVERRRYNQAVAEYTRTARSFPMVLVRPLLGFDAQKPYFQAAPEAQRAPPI